MLNHRNRTLAVLLSLVFAGTSLNLFATGNLLEPRAARAELKVKLLSAIDALQREAQKTSEDEVFTSTTIGMIVGAFVLPVILGSFDPDNSTSGTAEGLLKANVLDHILDLNHVTAQSENAVSFRLAPELCDKIALMTGGVADDTLAACRNFLGAHQLTFTLEKLSSQEMRLSFSANGVPTSRSDFVFALGVSKTSLGTDINLNGVRQFLTVATQSGLPVEALLPKFEAFEGVAQVAVRFDNEGAKSGCHDSGSICLVLNVVETIFVKSEPGKNQVMFRIGPSKADAPAVELAGNGQSSFFLKLNVGDFNADWGDQTTLRIPGLAGEIFIPRSTTPGEQAVELRDLSVGQGAAVVAFDGGVFALDLNKDLGRVVKAITLVWNELVGAFIEATDFDTSLSVLRDDEKCKTKENAHLRIRIGKHKTARIKADFLGGSRPRYKNDSDDCSVRENVVLGDFARLVNAPCDDNSFLNVERGSVGFEHHYEVNKERGTGSWKADEGQCIGEPKSKKDEL